MRVHVCARTRACASSCVRLWYKATADKKLELVGVVRQLVLRHTDTGGTGPRALLAVQYLYNEV